MSFYGLVMAMTTVLSLFYIAWLGVALHAALSIENTAAILASEIKLESMANIFVSQNMTAVQAKYFAELNNLGFNSSNGIIEMRDGSLYLILKR